MKGLFVSYLCLLNALGQGSPDSVLKGQCPAEFTSNLTQHTCMEFSSMPS